MNAPTLPSDLTKFAYRVKDAAPHMGISKAKLWELIAEGRVPARKLTAGVTVVLRDDIIAFLEGAPGGYGRVR
jgi:Helix-turn-helix domain